MYEFRRGTNTTLTQKRQCQGKLDILEPFTPGKGQVKFHLGIDYFTKWTLRICGNAFWSDQCSGSVHGFHEPDIPTIFG